jgi:cytochrome c oxidase assembly protein subunit 15
MFALVVVGAVVRSTGSGLACPDWPLCEGRVIPRFEFHVLIEWFHRVLALGISVLLLVTTLWVLAHREVRARLGGLVALAVVLLAVQVLLGALTVWKLLHPVVVTGHLAVGLLLFVTFLTTSLVAGAHARVAAPALPARPAGLLAAFGAVAALAYAQAVLGGVVSTNHAGLACPDWPTCHGEWLPALHGLVGLQMLHRFGAYLLAGAVLLAAFAARQSADRGVRLGAWAAFALVLVQIALGVANVLLGLPTWASAAHLGTATLLIGTLLTVALRVARQPARRLHAAALRVPGAA